MVIRIGQNKFLVFNIFGTSIRRASDQKIMGISNLTLSGDALFSSDRIAITTSAKQTLGVYVASAELCCDKILMNFNIALKASSKQAH